MGKKIAGLVIAFLVFFCFEGPISGGHGAEKEVLKKSILTEQQLKEITKVEVRDVDVKKTNTTMEAIASWYGPGFHGRLTANGEIFDQNALTAAHKELPFGTKLKITNLMNGKSTIVKINDRGPFIEGRQLDLSKAAAKEIDMILDGVIKVNMEIIN